MPQALHVGEKVRDQLLDVDKGVSGFNRGGQRGSCIATLRYGKGTGSCILRKVQDPINPAQRIRSALSRPQGAVSRSPFLDNDPWDTSASTSASSASGLRCNAPGRQEGRQTEAQALIQRLLQRRIGLVTPDQQARILALSVDELESLGEALLDFSTSADLTAWLERH